MGRLLHHLVLAVSLVALGWPASCQRGPVLVPVTKDSTTSLYTIPFHYGANLVVDIAGPLVWSTCQSGHLPAGFPCKSDTCRLANAYPVPNCQGGGCDPDASKHKTCTAYPYNPVTGSCTAGKLVHNRFVANTTDGINPVSQVNVNVVSACATPKLFKSLPQGTTGVAGLAGSDMALPAQVASARKVAKKFLLCLSRGGVYGDGVAIFGGGPLHLTQEPGKDYTKSLDYTPLLTRKDNPAYYVSVKYIALEETSIVPLPARALATGGVVLRTTVPYTVLRTDVYRPFAAAFRKAMAALSPSAREVKAVAPFGLCYDARTLGNTRSGYFVPSVTLALDGGKNWTMTGVNSMVDVKGNKACLAFVEMKGVKAGDGKAPAVIVGGFQIENFVLQFDLGKKKQLGFFRLPFFTNCGHFNFTRSGY